MGSSELKEGKGGNYSRSRFEALNVDTQEPTPSTNETSKELLQETTPTSNNTIMNNSNSLPRSPLKKSSSLLSPPRTKPALGPSPLA